jgi:hypothetical protein
MQLQLLQLLAAGLGLEGLEGSNMQTLAGTHEQQQQQQRTHLTRPKLPHPSARHSQCSLNL